jgi:hypothetical protein
MGKWKGKIIGTIIFLMVCLLSISLVGTPFLEDLSAFHPNNNALSLSGSERSLVSSKMNTTGSGIIWRAQLARPAGLAVAPDGTNYVTHYQKTYPYVENPYLEARTPDGGVRWSAQIGDL